MDAKPLSVARELYARFRRGDLAGIAALTAHDVTWRMPAGRSVPYFGTYRGREGVAEFFARLLASEDPLEFEPLEFLDGGTTVVVLGREVSRAKRTGKEFRGDWVHVLRVKDGLITEFVEHIDSQALAEIYAPA